MFVIHVYVLSRLSFVQLFVTLWAVVHQAALSMVFLRQEYWNGTGMVCMLSSKVIMTQDWTQVSRLSCIGQVGSSPTEPPGNGKRQKY